MKINKTKILDHGDWYTYKYESSTISAEKVHDNYHPDYIHVVMIYTRTEDHGKGYFKKNLENIVEHVKTNGYKGIYMIKNKLTKMARERMETGVKNGWLRKEGSGASAIYIME